MMEGPKIYKIMGFHCPECFDDNFLPYNTEEERERADKIRFCGNCDVGENRVTKVIMDYVPADLVRELEEALEKIASGTEDLLPPFRCMPASNMQKIARVALAALKAMEG